ncbi:hypothetical protein BHM03_00007166, partial [Ensete ventricosum]
QCSLISGYFYDFTEERTMMLNVFPDVDLGSMAHDRKKEQEKGIYMTPTVMMPFILMLALPERGNVFVLGADTSRVGIGDESLIPLHVSHVSDRIIPKVHCPVSYRLTEQSSVRYDVFDSLAVALPLEGGTV